MTYNNSGSQPGVYIVGSLSGVICAPTYVNGNYYGYTGVLQDNMYKSIAGGNGEFPFISDGGNGDTNSAWSVYLWACEIIP